MPAALIAVSAFRLVSWFKARAGVEFEALDRIRRKVRVASVLGPALTLAFALTMAISTWRDNVAEFALALLAVWVIAAVCAICLDKIAREANVIVIVATGALVAHSGPWGGVDDRACGSGRRRRLFYHPNARRALSHVLQNCGSRFIIAEGQRVAEEGRMAAMTIALTDDLTGLRTAAAFTASSLTRSGRRRRPASPSRWA